MSALTPSSKRPAAADLLRARSARVLLGQGTFGRGGRRYPVVMVRCGPVLGFGQHDPAAPPASREASMHAVVRGHVRQGFEAVREAFADNFASRGELGAACCIYHNGVKVVDLWGGLRNKATGEPWEKNTMVLVFSAAKGPAAMALAVAHSRDLLDYEENVCTYWPAFAQHGKEHVTVRQLLSHQAGLFAFDEPVDRSVVADPDQLAVILARQKPAWAPGTRQAYHAITLGFYESELLRRIDPQHRSLGQFFQDEIAAPLDLDFYIRLPATIPNSRLAVLEKINPVKLLMHLPLPLILASVNRHAPIYRAVIPSPGPWLPLDKQRIYARNLEVPSVGGVGTARALAKAYSVFATGGRGLRLRPETLQALTAPPVPPQRGFHDECVKTNDVPFSLGFMTYSRTWSFGHPGAFGAPGTGGSIGYADPAAGIGFAYVTNRMGATLIGDPRDLALRTALDHVTSDQPAA